MRKFPLRTLVLLGAVSLAAWWLVPGSRFERAVLGLCIRGSANPPFFVVENKNRWDVRTVAAKPRVDPGHAPLLVSLDDDPEGVFQTSPPSPVDLAVIFSNLRRLGAKQAACAASLAWDAPDPISLLALERALADFESMIMAAPLGRGAVAGTMPQAFRKASVGVFAVRGDASKLPLVNRVILPDAVLGGDNAWAGFQFLENDPRAMPMLARWEDRVVFAFPLLCAIRLQGTPLDKIMIRLGESIRLGANGPVVPIDSSGCLAVPVTMWHDTDAMSAADLIDAPDDWFTKRKNALPILRDNRGAAESATRAFSKSFPTVIPLIASDAGLTGSHTIRRTGGAFDAVLLAVWCLLLAAVIRMSDFPQTLGFIGIAAVLCIAQAGAVLAGHWLPGLPAIAAMLVAVVIARIPFLRRRIDPAK